MCAFLHGYHEHGGSVVVVPITIGSNIAALQATRRLNQTTNELARSFERLSTGMRINRASDDAAGLGIASSLNVDARVLGRARLNLNDATSMLSVADGLAGSVTDIVTRMSEIASQAANGTLSSSQRLSVQREYSALEKELKRLTATSTFNGIGTLSGLGRTEMSATTLASGLTAGPMATSADGRYVSWVDGTEIVRLDTETSTTIRFASEGAAVAGIRVLNNGDVFWGDDAGTGATQIYRGYGATGQIQRLTANVGLGDGIQFDVSADGRIVAFNAATNYTNGGQINLGYTAGGGTPRMWVLDTSTGIVRHTGEVTVLASAVTVSSNGSYVGYNSNSLQARVINTSTMAPTTSVSLSGSQTALGISNSGEYYFTNTANYMGQNPSGNRQIFRFNGATGGLTQLTSFTVNGGYIGELSLDGSELFFASTANILGDSSGVRQAYRMNVDAAAPTITRLTNFSTNIGFSNLTTDGSFGLYLNGSTLQRFDLRPKANTVNIETGTGGANQIAVELEAILGATRGFGSYDLSLTGHAQAALARMKENLKGLGRIRGTIGAALSRIESAASVTSNQQSELMTSESRIRDADIAEESATLVRRQIVQRAAAAVLSQANLQPQITLQLLNGARR